MSDPAFAAATRAVETSHEWPKINYYDLVTAAHEALKPIRELHKPAWSNCINACCSGEQCPNRYRACGSDDEEWPCATARLVYSEDELS